MHLMPSLDEPKPFQPRLPATPPGQILVVEDHPYTAQTIVDLLTLDGHRAIAVSNGPAAFAALRHSPPDLIILDVNLPGMDGYNVCAALKRDAATWDIPVILMTVEHHRAAHLRGIEAEADVYLEKPLDPEQLAAHVRVLIRLRRRTQQLERAEDVIFALARTVEAKDAYTEGHLQRMATFAEAIGDELGMDTNALLALRYGALLHDVGKVGIDEAIIRKQGPLTEDEYLLVQQHPLIGERIVAPLRLGTAVAPIVRHHHERWDGQGYPDGLSGEEIPLGARIVAVADAFDAMTTQRPYNRVLSAAEAADRLRQGAGTYWDPRAVTAFLHWLAQARTGPLKERVVAGD